MRWIRIANQTTLSRKYVLHGDKYSIGSNHEAVYPFLSVDNYTVFLALVQPLLDAIAPTHCDDLPGVGAAFCQLTASGI